MGRKLEFMVPYRIKFYDHSTGFDVDHAGMICDTLGFFIKENENFYTFSYWEVEDEEAKASNREAYQVFKKAIISCRKLR